MKILRNISLLLLFVAAGYGVTQAQSSKQDKKDAKAAAIKQKVDAKRYTFAANYVMPQRGGAKALTSPYDLKITPDSVISFLPYFGRAYFDVGYNPTEGGIKFTSTKFDYKVTEKKKGGWEILIKPHDVKNLSSMTLYISPDGYASLGVNSVNKDFITFDGYLE